MSFRRRHRRSWTFGFAAVTLLSLSGCGSGGDARDGGGDAAAPDRPTDTVEGSADAAAPDRPTDTIDADVDVPIDRSADTLGDGSSEAGGGDGSGGACPIAGAPAAAACGAPPEQTWVSTPVPAPVPLSNGGLPGDMLGGVTSAGVFSRDPTTGELRRWVGSRFQVVTTAAPFDGDVRASGDADVWIVPRAKDIPEVNPFFLGQSLSDGFSHWNGTAWTVVAPPTEISGKISAFHVGGGELWVAAVLGPDSFHRQTVLYRWKSGAWSLVPSPLDGIADAQLDAMWGSAPDDVWAGGQSGRDTSSSDPILAVVLHWDGARWTALSPPVFTTPYKAIFSIWGSSSRDVWFAGVDFDPNLGGGGNVWHFDGTSWTDAGLATTTSLTSMFALWGTGPTDVWVTGYAGTAAIPYHFDGTGWSDYVDFVRMHVGDRDEWVWPTQVKGTGADDLWASGRMGDSITTGELSATLLHRQLETCGDGTVTSCEECDPPRQPMSGLQCDCSCHLLRCGNGQLDPGEECDPPETTNVLALCDATCHFPTCGNHKLDPGEDCDPPDVGAGNTCDGTCKAIPVVCGNDIVQTGESCEYPDGFFCQHCQITACGAGLRRRGGLRWETEAVCPRLQGAARDNCRALFNCIAEGVYICVYENTCNSTCTNEVNAVGSTTANALFDEVLRVGTGVGPVTSACSS